MKRLLCALALVVFAATPALADPKSDLLAAMGHFAKATTFHMSVTGRGRTMNGDFALPTKMHIISPQFEMIKIDTTTWVKLKGTWQKFALPGTDHMLGGSTAPSLLHIQRMTWS